MKLLLDTTVLIDVLRNRKGRRQVLADLVRAGHTFSTSVLNVAEVYAGMRAGEEARTEAFLEGLEEFDIGGQASRAAGKIKMARSKKPHDYVAGCDYSGDCDRERVCAPHRQSKRPSDDGAETVPAALSAASMRVCAERKTQT
jgi:predicted nucleic acid-binding protein